MAALVSANPTLADVQATIGSDGRMMDVINMLIRSNPFIQDATLIEGTEFGGNKSMQLTGQPSGAFRLYNEGIPVEKATYKTIQDSCGNLESWSEIDVGVLEDHPNPAMYRKWQDDAHVEGLGITAEEKVFYGNEITDPAGFTGLLPRYDKIAGGETSDNVINGGGSSNRSSIWLIDWSPRTCFLFHGRGQKGGLQVQNLPEATKYDGSGNPYRVVGTKFHWNIGLALADFRYCARIGNVDAASLGTDFVFKLIDMVNAVPKRGVGMGRRVIYMNKTVNGALEKQIVGESANSIMALPWVDWHGQQVKSFQGIPIIIADAITNAESAMTA